MEARKSLNTRKAYASGWKAFCAWCAAVERPSLPATPQTAQDFATWSIARGYRLSTVSIRMSALTHFHERAGFASPFNDSVRRYLCNARRELREEPAGKAALTYDMLRRSMPHFPGTAAGVRNRAMILLAFASGWRRSEIVALRFGDVHFLPQGVALWQRSSKTDQVGKGRLVGIEPGQLPLTCPVRALAAWLELRGRWEGALFVRMNWCGGITRSPLEPRGEVLHHALRRALAEIGEDPARFGAHSLRSGMITEASKHGASEASIKQRTGHKCSETLQRYIRPAGIFDFNPLKAVL